MAHVRARRVLPSVLALPCCIWAIVTACSSYSTPNADDAGADAGPDVVTPPAPPPPADAPSDVGPTGAASRLYVVGGFDAAGAHVEAYSAAINVDGSLSSWRAEGATSKSIELTGAFATSRGVFLVGGGDEMAPTADVLLGETDPSGVIKAWAKAGAIPGTVYAPAVAATASDLLVIGGTGANGIPTNDVFRAPLADGAPGLFTSFGKLPSFFTQVGAVRVGDTLFMIGGADSGGLSVGDVESAAITASGLGSWKQETNLPSPRRAHVALVAGTHVYAMGGRLRDQAIVLDDVLVADVSAGTIASWAVTTPLPAARMYACGVFANGFLYVIGGVEGYADASAGTLGESKATVYRAHARADGSLEPWVVEPPLPVLRAAVGCAAR